MSDAIVRTLQSIVPGPAGMVLTEAVQQAHQASSSGQWSRSWSGTIGAVVTGTTLMGQIERALNRLYGVEQDRPRSKKYGRAFLLTLIRGLLAVLAFVATRDRRRGRLVVRRRHREHDLERRALAARHRAPDRRRPR